MRRTASLLNGYLAVAVLALAASCAAPPPPVPPTVVTLKLTAASDVNASAPVAVRVYQLASASGFETAEFFRLYNTDAAVLGTDLIKKDELLLAPGETKSLSLAPTDQVHAIGVFAAYRDFAHVAWRQMAAVPAHQTTSLVLTAGAVGLKLAPAP